MTEGEDQAVEPALLVEEPVEEPTAPAPRRPARPRPVRAPVVHDWRWVIGVVGRVFIVLGLLIFAFVAYQLWGTGIEFRANQNQLENEFEDIIATVPSTAPTTTVAATTTTLAPTTTTAAGTTTSGASVTSTTTTSPPTTTVPAPTLPPIQLGDVVGKLEMPTITGTAFYLVAGVGVDDLKKGVGHFPGTPLPGQLGNAALAGHRTTYGHPFEDIDDLKPGDPIIVTTLLGERYVYIVDQHDHDIIEPSNTSVLAQPDDDTVARLTLTTCHPKHSTKKRYVVYANLDRTQSAAPTARTSNYQPIVPPTTSTLPTTTALPPTTVAGPATTPAPGVTNAAPSTTLAPTTTVAPTTTALAALPGEGDDDSTVRSSDARAFARGWFHDHGAWVQITLWGLVLIAISLGAWRLGRHFGRTWLSYVVGFAPFIFCLYFFFQNVNRLLPPGL